MDEAFDFSKEAEVSNQVPKTCIASVGQQGPPKMIAKTLKMAVSQNWQEHKIHTFTNGPKLFLWVWFYIK